MTFGSPAPVLSALVWLVAVSFLIQLPVRGEARFAEPVEWTGAAGDGLWETAGNWMPTQVPGPDSSVRIGSDSGEVLLETATAILALEVDGYLRVKSPAGTLSAQTIINRGSIRLDHDDAVSSIGHPLTVASGGTLINDGLIVATGGSSTVRIIGSFANRGTVLAEDGVMLQLGGGIESAVSLKEGGSFGGVNGGMVASVNSMLHLKGGELRDGFYMDGGTLRTESTFFGQTIVAENSFTVAAMDQAGTILSLRGSTLSADQIVTFPEAFVNKGAIRMEGRNIILTVANDEVLTNEGLILARRADGGERRIDAHVINRGSIRAEGGGVRLLLGAVDREVTLDDGGTLEGTDGGLVVVNLANFRVRGGAMLDGAYLERGNLSVEASAPAQTIRVLNGFTLLQLDSPEVAVSAWAVSPGVINSQPITVPDGFVNRGTIRMESEAYFNDLRVTNDGTMINEGTISAGPAGNGHERRIEANIINRDTIRSEGDKNLIVGRSHFFHLIASESGLIEATGTGSVKLLNGNVRLSGGELRGRVWVERGTLQVEESFPEQTVPVLGRFTLREMSSPDVTLWLQGDITAGSGSGTPLHQSMSLLGTVVNRGTILLEPINEASGIVVIGFDEPTLINEGLIVAKRGTGGDRTITVSLINRGTVRAEGTPFQIGASGQSVVQQEGGILETASGGTLVLSETEVLLEGGELREGVHVSGGSLRVRETLSAQTVMVQDDCTLLEHDGADVTVWLAGGSGAHQVVSVPDGFVNRGILRLASVRSWRNIFLRAPDKGGLTNEGSLVSLRGVGGDRTPSR